MVKNIGVIRGDCSSPEIVAQALRVLDKIAVKYNHTFNYTEIDMGGAAIDKYGDPLPQAELDKCLASDSVLLGAVGGPKWEGMPGPKRPEKGLLRLRAGMGLYSNNRPATLWPQLADASPLKPSIVAKGIDFIVVRELTGGVYFGEHRTEVVDGEKVATDIMPYSEHEIERIGRIGFETAMKRRKKLCCVDKANVLDTSRLWREVMHRLQAEYPEVEYSEMFVDNCAIIPSSRKIEYLLFAASINTISYSSESVGNISTAFPNIIFILSEKPIFFTFSIASFALSSSISIVSIIHVSSVYLAKHAAEYPTAVPISNILFGLCSFNTFFIVSKVSSIIIGI